jgi:sugar/nucleoside kinase (ribokinase family)
MLVAVGELKADSGDAPIGQLRLDEDAPATISLRGGGAAANFCSWAARLGERARLVIPALENAGLRRLAAQLEADGVEVRAVSGAVAEHLAGARLVHVEARTLLASPVGEFVRSAVDAARGGGALVSVDLGSAGWIRAHGPSRVAYQLAVLRPDILFASRTAAGELAVPLEGLASVPVLTLGAEGCSVYGRRLVAPRVDALDSSGAKDALAAAFCAAFVEGEAPVEAAGRAVLVAAR